MEKKPISNLFKKIFNSQQIKGRTINIHKRDYNSQSRSILANNQTINKSFVSNNQSTKVSTLSSNRRFKNKSFITELRKKVYKDLNTTLLKDIFRKREKFKMESMPHLPNDNKEKINKILNKVYEKGNIKLNVKLIKPKIPDNKLFSFDIAKYQESLLEQMGQYFELNTLLKLKREFTELNKKLKKGVLINNRWIELALRNNGILPKHLIKKFCELGRARFEIE